MKPYYADDTTRLFCGDCREVLPALGERFDAAIADPPYKATPLAWDQWPTGWLAAVAEVTNSLWCFGNLRMFGTRWPEFAVPGWKLSHDAVGEFEIDTTVWEKHAGSRPIVDRLAGVHELVAFWYRGRWAGGYHQVPRVPAPPGVNNGRRTKRKGGVGPHLGTYGPSGYVDDGTRFMRSVIYCRSTNHRAIHPTQKPTDLLIPLIEYAVPSGGVILDPMAGSCSTGIAAKQRGIPSVLIEGDEAMCEKAAIRLATYQPDLLDELNGEAS